MINFHYVRRPSKLRGFITRGDFVSVVDGDDHKVYMRIGSDGSNEDPMDYPDYYFQFGRAVMEQESEQESDDGSAAV